MTDTNNNATGPSNLVPNFAGEFYSFQNWVNTAAGRITKHAICVDIQGRICRNGGDFMRARDENAFPVRFFYDMAVVPRDTFSIEVKA